MGVKIEELVPEMQAKLREFVAACAEDSRLKAEGHQLIITEGRRADIVQARYFCQGRTPSEIAAALDRKGADQIQRGFMQLAIEEIFGAAALPEDRAPGRIITNALPCTGPHCLAVAFHARLKHGAHVLDDGETPWRTLGEIGKKCGLVWGGEFKFAFDGEHYELPKALWPKPEPIRKEAA